MSVFVDDACIPFGRMIMCHMIASETQELLTKEHFDVSLGYKRKAIAAGAIDDPSKEISGSFQPGLNNRPANSTQYKIIDRKGTVWQTGQRTKIQP